MNWYVPRASVSTSWSPPMTPALDSVTVTPGSGRTASSSTDPAIAPTPWAPADDTTQPWKITVKATRAMSLAFMLHLRRSDCFREESMAGRNTHRRRVATTSATRRSSASGPRLEGRHRPGHTSSRGDCRTVGSFARRIRAQNASFTAVSGHRSTLGIAVPVPAGLLFQHAAKLLE